MVGGQLHHKGGRLTCEGPRLFQHDAGEDDRSHTDEVGGGGHPGGAAEQGARKQSDDGHLGSAGDKAGGHNGHFAVPVLLNGAGGHDAWDAAAGGHQHGDKGLAGQAEAAEDPVHDEGDAGHIAAVLQHRQQQEEHQHLGNKAQYSAHTGHNAILDQAVEHRALHHVQRPQHGVKPAGNDLSKEHIVGPVGAKGADPDAPGVAAAVKQGGGRGPHGNGIDQAHHHHEDGQGQDPVGHDPVDPVRDGHSAAVLLIGPL